MTALSRPTLRVVRSEHEEPTSIGHRIHHALVCLDGSAASDVCLPYAQIVAEAFGAEVTLTHVMPSMQPGSGVWSRTDVLEWEIERRAADRYLENARELLAERLGPAVRAVLTQGSPPERIVATAREVGADLTIVASDAAMVPRAGRIGGTAQRVLAMSTGSVLLAQGAASLPPQRIVVPLDGSARTESVLPAVIALARTYGAEVVLVHIVSEPTTSAVLSDPQDVTMAQQLARRLEKSAQQYLERVRTRALRDLSNVRIVVRARSAEHRALLDVVTQQRADLVVLAAHGMHCDAESAYGSVTAYLLARASVPMLVVQDVLAPEDAPNPAHAPRRPSGIRRKEDA